VGAGCSAGSTVVVSAASWASAVDGSVAVLSPAVRASRSSAGSRSAAGAPRVTGMSVRVTSTGSRAALRGLVSVAVAVRSSAGRSPAGSVSVRAARAASAVSGRHAVQAVNPSSRASTKVSSSLSRPAS
jgi:hypothetical protein